MMLALPNHVAVRLITEDGDIPPPDEFSQPAQIFLSRYTSRWIVRRVQKNGLGFGMIAYELLHIVQIGPELILLPK
jgi:hypothetical protein